RLDRRGRSLGVGGARGRGRGGEGERQPGGEQRAGAGAKAGHMHSGRNLLMPSESTKNGCAQSGGGLGAPPAAARGAGGAAAAGGVDAEPPPPISRLFGVFAPLGRGGLASSVAAAVACSSGCAVASGDVAVRLACGRAATVAGAGAWIEGDAIS